MKETEYVKRTLTHKDNETLSRVNELAQSRPVTKTKIAARLKQHVPRASIIKMRLKLLNQDVIRVDNQQRNHLSRMRIKPRLDRSNNLRKWPHVEQETVAVTLPDLPVFNVHLRREVPHAHVQALLRVLELVVRGSLAYEGGVVRGCKGDVAVLSVAQLCEAVAGILGERPCRQGEGSKTEFEHLGANLYTGADIYKQSRTTCQKVRKQRKADTRRRASPPLMPTRVTGIFPKRNAAPLPATENDWRQPRDRHLQG